MPDSIKVGPHTYSVLRKSTLEMPKDWGSCDPGRLQIWVRNRLKKSKAQDILLHEIFHAALHSVANGSSKNEEEAFVEALSPAFLHVLQNNPKFVEYLTK